MKLYARPSRDLDNGLESAIRVDRVHKAVLPVPRKLLLENSSNREEEEEEEKSGVGINVERIILPTLICHAPPNPSCFRFIHHFE